MKRAVVVFSGGQDSTTCLAQARHQYDEVHCVTFDYGQRHRAEIDVARALALKLGARAHKVLDVTLLNELAVSSLTRDSIPVPDYEPNADGIPNTFVPGRNILFLTLAAIYAYQVKAEAVITGVCETDFSGYPDCRDEFVKALNHAVNLGMAKDIRFETPLMWIDKAETWALADYWGQLDLVREETLTCYNGIKGDGCGHCAACNLRANGLNHYLSNKAAVMAAMKQKNRVKVIVLPDGGACTLSAGDIHHGQYRQAGQVQRHQTAKRYCTICSSFSRNSPSSGSAFCVFKSIQTNVMSASATTCPSGSSVIVWLNTPLLPLSCCTWLVTVNRSLNTAGRR